MQGLWGFAWSRVAETVIVLFAATYAVTWWWASVPRNHFVSQEAGADFIEGLALAPVAALMTSTLFPEVSSYLVNHDSPILAGASFMAVLALIERGIKRKRAVPTSALSPAWTTAQVIGTWIGSVVLIGLVVILVASLNFAAKIEAAPR